MKIWDQAEEAERLKRRFKGVNQAQFARDFKVPGGPSMLSQHIKGRRPINMEAAIAYARGFGVALREISPRLAAQAVAAASEPPDQSEPPTPPARFEDRHEVSDSDLARLEELRDIESAPPLARKLAELRAELAELKAFSDAQYRKRLEAAQHTGGHAGGMSAFGELGEPAAPAAPAKTKRGRK